MITVANFSEQISYKASLFSFVPGIYNESLKERRVKGQSERRLGRSPCPDRTGGGWAV